jgi:hypothetical protein
MGGRLLGSVPAAALLDISHHEHAQMSLPKTLSCVA